MISDEELYYRELTACPSCGSCAGMYTANSMNCLSEVVGIGLPGNGTIPAVYSQRLRLAKEAGMKVVELLEKDIKIRDIITKDALENALVCDMALGCSTNTILHLLAIAHEASIEIDLDLINEISSKVPNLCHLAPAGNHTITDLYMAGGLQSLMNQLDSGGFLKTDLITVTGTTIKENIQSAFVNNSEVIRPLDNPYSETGGIAVLFGNIAKDGCVVKQSAVDSSMLSHTGKARVFDSEEDAIKSIYNSEIKDKEYIKNAFDNQSNVNVKVKEEIKGGVIGFYGSIRVFIPGSLASRERVELSSLVGKELEVRITELDFKNRKIVGSRKAIEQEEYNKEKKKIWASLKEGEKRTGVVKKIAKFGAFVDIGGVQGLIHLNDLSWERVKRVEDVVKENDEVEVFIGNVDRKNEKLSLILKDVKQEPWTIHADDIKEGEIMEGTVIRLTSFGAFVELFSGIEGLVHISEITDDNIAKPSEKLEINQKVKVKVLSYDKEQKKIALSIKDAVEKNIEYMQYIDNDENDGTSLADLLKDFKF